MMWAVHERPLPESHLSGAPLINNLYKDAK